MSIVTESLAFLGYRGVRGGSFISLIINVAKFMDG
jgi:hypothetical protein